MTAALDPTEVGLVGERQWILGVCIEPAVYEALLQFVPQTRGARGKRTKIQNWNTHSNYCPLDSDPTPLKIIEYDSKLDFQESYVMQATHLYQDDHCMALKVTLPEPLRAISTKQQNYICVGCHTGIPPTYPERLFKKRNAKNRDFNFRIRGRLRIFDPWAFSEADDGQFYKVSRPKLEAVIKEFAPDGIKTDERRDKEHEMGLHDSVASMMPGPMMPGVPGPPGPQMPGVPGPPGPQMPGPGPQMPAPVSQQPVAAPDGVHPDLAEVDSDDSEFSL